MKAATKVKPRSKSRKNTMTENQPPCEFSHGQDVIYVMRSGTTDLSGYTFDRMEGTKTAKIIGKSTGLHMVVLVSDLRKM